MKKLGKTFVVGTAFAASMVLMNGCATMNEVPVAVYGPPEDFIETQAEAETTENFDPENEIIEDVYGPPVEEFDVDED